METSEALEFVNRGSELAFLRQCIERAVDSPALVLIRAPAGFGKSRLTEQFAARSLDLGRAFCVVDPSIRGRTGTADLYAGFFMQRCAEALNAAAMTYDWPTLAEFLQTKPWKSAATKKAIDIIAEMPSFGHAYKVVFDYAARTFSFGRFAPKQLLASDQADAVSLCSAYAEWIFASHRIALILREAHHIDLESFRALLERNRRGPSPDLIVEYTTDNEQFEPEHQKLLLRAAEGRSNVHLLDLVRLERDHLEYLIKRNVQGDLTLSSDYYLSWNGNLRAIVELKFQVGIGRAVSNGAQIGRALNNLNETLADHIKQLSSVEKLILAIVSAHVEGISRTTLAATLRSIDPRASQTGADRAIEKLQTTHDFLFRADGAFRIQNETIAIALNEADAMKAPLALAEKHLRDYYASVLERENYTGVGVADAVRQYFRLCAKTKDVVGLLRAKNRLSQQINDAQDQSIYVDVVASAIEADPDLYGRDQDELIDWAAGLAYDTCDWARAAGLLKIKKYQDPFAILMRACAIQEIGGHEEALTLAARLHGEGKAVDEILSGELLEALIIGCRGEHDQARARLVTICENPRFQESPLLGYALRFFEVVDGFLEALPRLRASIAWFERHGFKKSKAYSQLPAAMFLARSGDVPAAQALIAEARSALVGEVRDQHMILNNSAAVDLLGDGPDFIACRDALTFALRLARDDFTEVTILTNLGLAYQGAKDQPAATDCADRCMSILERHDFADTDIYWPVAFNAAQIYRDAGLTEKAARALRFPQERGRQRADNKQYWQYRFGLADQVEEPYRFLASRPRHPLYLSHWLIDLEGLNLLKTAPPQ